MPEALTKLRYDGYQKCFKQKDPLEEIEKQTEESKTTTKNVISKEVELKKWFGKNLCKTGRGLLIRGGC